MADCQDILSDSPKMIHGHAAKFNGSTTKEMFKNISTKTNQPIR